MTIMERLGLAGAVVSRGRRDQVKLQYTMGEEDTSAPVKARLQDG